MEEMEYRFFSSVELETRSPTSSQFIGQISGYAIKFDTPSTAIPQFVESVSSKALDNVDLSDVLALYNHDYANILGRVKSGTLSLKIDNIGLFFTLDMPDTSISHDVYNNVKAGNLRGMSFGFVIAKNGDSWSQISGTPVRTIEKLESLSEISVVSRPAYEDTSVQVTRSLDAFMMERAQKYKDKVKAYLEEDQ